MNMHELKRIAPALDAELKAVFARHGLNWHTRSAKLAEQTGEMTYKIQLRAPTVSGESPELITLKRDARMIGFDPAWAGRSFTLHGRTFVLEGINWAKKRYPIMASSAGRRYKLTVEDVRRAFTADSLTRLVQEGV